MKLAFNLPLNPVSFGQTSTLLLRTLFEREKNASEKNDIYLFPIGNVNLESQNVTSEFKDWIREKILNGLENYNKDIPIFKLWHLNGSLESFSKNQTLLTFYELDQPTKIEINIAKNNNIYFSSKYTCEVFKKNGVEAKYMPLAFDSFNFFQKNKKYFNDERIVFNLCGKFEKRKHHAKIIKSWIKKYGNNPKFSLQCAVYNPFLNEEQNQQLLMGVLEGNKPFNVNFFPMMNENSVYNDFLNSADVIIGMSGGEGFGLPEFQSIAIGKHAVLMKAHAYKDWASDDMVSWVEPHSKTSVYDGVFFHPNQPFNQGNIFDFNEDDFIDACEKVILKVHKNKINEEGLELQKKYSKENFLNNVISSIV
jgi:hypothetical protein